MKFVDWVVHCSMHRAFIWIASIESEYLTHLTSIKDAERHTYQLQLWYMRTDHFSPWPKVWARLSHLHCSLYINLSRRLLLKPTHVQRFCNFELKENKCVIFKWTWNFDVQYYQDSSITRQSKLKNNLSVQLNFLRRLTHCYLCFMSKKHVPSFSMPI